MATSVPGFCRRSKCWGQLLLLKRWLAEEKQRYLLINTLPTSAIDQGREGENPYESKAHLDLSQVIPTPAKKPTISIPEELKGNMLEVNHGLAEEEVQQEAGRCLNCGGCAECMECVRACESHAVIHEMLPKEQILDVGSIVVASGFEESDVSAYRQYGWGSFPNVVTSIQFERILSASGPFSGIITRPGDKNTLRKLHGCNVSARVTGSILIVPQFVVCMLQKKLLCP